jgi:Uncharacterised methyltransferase family (DUF6094)
MARLESDAKLGFYPTPDLSLRQIGKHISFPEEGECHLLDPCCGEGAALKYIDPGYESKSWGIELDPERAVIGSGKLGRCLCASMYETRINPLGCMGLLWLNPPYSTENKGERAEVKFLRHAVKWLTKDGLLVYIVPEHLFYDDNLRMWMSQSFKDIRVFRLHRDDYPRFRQAVLFGVKREKPVPQKASFAKPPYQHIEDIGGFSCTMPATTGPTVFQSNVGISDDDIAAYRPQLMGHLKELFPEEIKVNRLSPLFPLRKGHLVALIIGGLLDGPVETGKGSPIIIKGFSERIKSERTETEEVGDKTKEKLIVTDTYSVGIRVLDTAEAKWYDIK